MNESLPALAEQLDSLEAMTREQLAERWQVAFDQPVPAYIRVSLLRSALAWSLQMQEGKKAGTAPSQAQLVKELSRALSPSKPSVAPGTRLFREWQGVTHQVTVIPDGFEYLGKTHRSLTAIARQITGTAWSGPLFFGLRT